MSSLADRIKIMRMLRGSSSTGVDSDVNDDNNDFHHPDISLSIQFILNCGGEIAGSCQGGKWEKVMPCLYLLHQAKNDSNNFIHSCCIFTKVQHQVPLTSSIRLATFLMKLACHTLPVETIVSV
jgi:hypothetical protein